MFTILILTLLCSITFAAPAGEVREDWVVLFKPQLNQLSPHDLARQAGIAVQDIKETFDVNGHAVVTASITASDADRLDQDDSTLAVALNKAELKAQALIEQLGPGNYGLGRVSHRARGNYSAYRYDDSAGAGTCIYVMDTGTVDATGSEFTGRLFQKGNFVPGEDSSDLNGHGTHVAGIAASNTYGAAKKARVYAVKVLNKFGGSSSLTPYMRGVAQIVSDAKAEAKTSNCPRGFLINISIGLDIDQGLSGDALIRLQQQGAMLNQMTSMLLTNTDPPLLTFIAAGNFNHWANLTAPGNTPGACTIGNTDGSDFIYRGVTSPDLVPNVGASCFGTPIQLFAPGTKILSTYARNFADPVIDLNPPSEGPFANFTKIITGTSMSAPLVAGVAATILGVNNTKFTTQSMCQFLQTTGTQASIQNLADPAFTSVPLAPNILAYNGNGI